VAKTTISTSPIKGTTYFRKLDMNTGTLTAVAGIPPGSGLLADTSGVALRTAVNLPYGMTLDRFGNLYFRMREHTLSGRCPSGQQFSRYSGCKTQAAAQNLYLETTQDKRPSLRSG